MSADSTIADSTKMYLDYLDKEMTIQGILSAFCVAAGAAAFDRVLDTAGSGLNLDLQGFSRAYVLSAIIALMVAALFFYLQRSGLAWLHGQISLAIARDMRELPTPPDASSLTEGFDIGNSWSLWNCYKFGMSFLAVTAVEAVCALFFAIGRYDLGREAWVIAAVPFLIAIVVDLSLRHVMGKRDEHAQEAGQLEGRNLRTARRKRRQTLPSTRR